MDKFSKLIFSIIALTLIGINIQLFKQNEIHLVKEAHAVEYHGHGTYDVYDLEGFIEDIVEDCSGSGWVDGDWLYSLSLDC